MTAAMNTAAGGFDGRDPFAVDIDDVLDVIREHWHALYSDIGCTGETWHATHIASGDRLTDDTADGLVRQFIARLGAQ